MGEKDRKVCVPSKPHESKIEPREHVDWFHYEGNKKTGPCDQRQQYNTTRHIVEGIKKWYEKGTPGHPTKESEKK